MNVFDLTDEALDALTTKIAKGLIETDRANKLEILSVVVQELDWLDGEDAFGTEGWKHTFGVED